MCVYNTVSDSYLSNGRADFGRFHLYGLYSAEYATLSAAYLLTMDMATISRSKHYNGFFHIILTTIKLKKRHNVVTCTGNADNHVSDTLCAVFTITPQNDCL